MTIAPKHEPSAVLVGLFCHSLDAEGAPHWQGRVIGNPEPGWYLVQLFSWFMGHPTNCVLVPSAELAHWRFYRGADDWRVAGKAVDAMAARQAGEVML